MKLPHPWPGLLWFKKTYFIPPYFTYCFLWCEFSSTAEHLGISNYAMCRMVQTLTWIPTPANIWGATRNRRITILRKNVELYVYRVQTFVVLLGDMPKVYCTSMWRIMLEICFLLRERVTRFLPVFFHDSNPSGPLWNSVVCITPLSQPP